MELVHPHLRRIAAKHMLGERSGHTLQPCALVNEIYIRLSRLSRIEWQSRTQFFAVAGRQMRRVLVDYARRRATEKRGGGKPILVFDDQLGVPQERALDLLALDDALVALKDLDPRKSEIVELRFFGRLTINECAELLGVSPGTIKREWRFTRLWLHDQLTR